MNWLTLGLLFWLAMALPVLAIIHVFGLAS